MTSFRQLLKAGDFESLATALEYLLDVQVQPHYLALACNSWRDPLGFPFLVRKNHPDDDVLMWLKNRLAELGCFRPGCTFAPEVQLPVPLHVFFTHVEETPEQLARLRGGYILPSEKPRLARSKIVGTVKAIRPIDRVAGRVAGFRDSVS